jgi:hypothetical protein
MNPGEFVEAKKSYSIECFDGEDWYKVNRTHPDFAAAVAALQSLIRPSMDPMAGRVLAMREILDEEHIDDLRYGWRYVGGHDWARQS